MNIRRLRTIGIAALACILLAGCDTTPDPPKIETAVPPEVPKLFLAGGEHTYSVICDDEMGKDAANACAKLRAAISRDLSLSDDWVARGEEPEFGEYEILLGTTNRPESAELAEGLGASDYRIAVVGEKLAVVGGSDTALIHAVKRLINDIDGGAIPMNYNVYVDGAEDRDEYIADPDKFLCSWVMEFDVPDWLRDYEEKKASFADPAGRLMSSFHRGDYKYYPENSIEGIISAIQAGADNIELDLWPTKDGVIVLMHDETLTRTTDFADKAGKNGLPESAKIADWTLDELRHLRLRMNDGTQTDYVIPTFEEALIVCNGRTTIRLDRFDRWNWTTDIYPLIEKTGAWESCILNHHFEYSEQHLIRNTLLRNGAEDVLCFRNFPHSRLSDWGKFHKQFTDARYPYILVWGGFRIAAKETFVKEAASFLEEYKDQTRIYADCHKLSNAKETPEEWTYLYEKGIDIVMVDNGVALAKYIAENFTPTEY